MTTLYKYFTSSEYLSERKQYYPKVMLVA